MNQTSIYSWFGFPVPMGERFRLIKESGFDGVTLWWSDEFISVDGNKSFHPDLARRHGLFVENVHMPIFQHSGMWEDSIEGDAMERTLIDCINDCKSFGIPTAVAHITKGDSPPPCNQTGLDRLCRLVDAAERKDVNVALENLRRPDYLDFVFSHIKSKRLGLCYDSGHEHCFSKGVDLLNRYGSRLMALHLHDNDGTDDQHRIPGDGTFDWECFKRRLGEIRYAGAISLEVTNEFSVNGEDTKINTFLKRAYDAAKRLTV